MCREWERDSGLSGHRVPAPNQRLLYVLLSIKHIIPRMVFLFYKRGSLSRVRLSNYSVLLLINTKVGLRTKRLVIPAHVSWGSAALLHHVLGQVLGWCLCADHPGLQRRSFHSKGTEKSNKGPYCFFGSEQSTDLCLGDGIVLIVSY